MMKILISDAVSHNRENLAAYLMQSGLDVIGTAATGKETIALSNNMTPDILILDSNLPDVEIFAFITRLKKINSIKFIILLQVSYDADVARRSKRAGAYACLAKNEGIDPLIAAIQNIEIIHSKGVYCG